MNSSSPRIVTENVAEVQSQKRHLLPALLTMASDHLEAELQAWQSAVLGRLEFRPQPAFWQFAAIVRIVALPHGFLDRSDRPR